MITNMIMEKVTKSTMLRTLIATSGVLAVTLMSGCKSTYKITKKDGSVEYIEADRYYIGGSYVTFRSGYFTTHKTLQAECVESATDKEIAEWKAKQSAKK